MTRASMPGGAAGAGRPHRATRPAAEPPAAEPAAARPRRVLSARAVRQAVARRRIGQPVSDQRRSNVRFAALIVGLLAGGVCLLLALNTSAAANEVREQSLSTSIDSLSAQAQDLRRQIAEREAPGALAAAATALGMVPGSAPAFLVINADGSVSVMGDPKPAPMPPAPSPAPSDPNAAPGSSASPSGSTSAVPADPNAPVAPTPTPGANATPTPSATPTPGAQPTDSASAGGASTPASTPAGSPPAGSTPAAPTTTPGSSQ